MVKVTFEIDNELEQRFKKAVFKKKGMKRGNIKEAMSEAIKMWISENKKMGIEGTAPFELTIRAIKKEEKCQK